MTSLDDRVTRLENAFVDLVPLVRELVEGQTRNTAVLNQLVESHNQLAESHNRLVTTVTQLAETQNRMLETLAAHTAKLNEHSTDLTIIKGYLETQG